MTPPTEPTMSGEELGDWIEWSGGECPVAPDTYVETRHRGMGESPRHVAAFYIKGIADWWKHEHSKAWGHAGDIIAYRVVKP